MSDRKPRFTQYEMNRYVEVQKLKATYPMSPDYEPFEDEDIRDRIKQRKGKGLTDGQKALIEADGLVIRNKPLGDNDNAFFYWNLYNEANMEAWKNGTKPIPKAFGVNVGTNTNLNGPNVCDKCVACICPVPS